MIEFDEDEDLPDASDSLFSVCPRGGCEATLPEDERNAFREIHEDLVTAVRVRKPLKRSSAAMAINRQAASRKPLLWPSQAAWDLVLFQLERLDGHNGLDCHFVLELKSQAIGFSLHFLRSDMEVCIAVAKKSF